MLRVGAWLPVLLLPHVAVVEEFVGRGTATVERGDLDAARRLAQRRAREDAVGRAIAGVLGAEAAGPAAYELRSALAGSATRYVLRESVLREVNARGVIQVELRATVNRTRLTAELERLARRRTSPPTVPHMPVAACVVAQAPTDLGLAGQLRTRLQIALRALGLEALDACSTQAVGQARLRGAQLAVRAQVTVVAAEGVRGVELAGARGEARLEVQVMGETRPLVKGEGTAWGVEPAPAEAERAAGERALAAALGPVATRMAGRFPTAGAPDLGEKILHVSGLTAFGQQDQICGALERGGTAQLQCEPRRFSQGDAWYALRTPLPAAALVELLRREAFKGFRLRLRSLAAGTIWMQVAAQSAAGS
ncbi:MAG: hypothetical protein IT371_01590 [Deltaproteobacteria bacterium]|nr:hypothetical protein [Deltaproteobacteria bacterium]